MDSTGISIPSSAQSRFAAFDSAAAALEKMPQRAASSNRDEMREKVGDLVGNIFYGTLLRQMQESKLKGEYLHGGRGEEVFRAQLGMELAKRMGQSPTDPMSNMIYDAFVRRQGIEDGSRKSPATSIGIGKDME